MTEPDAPGWRPVPPDFHLPEKPRVIHEAELYDWGPDAHGMGTVTAAVQQTLASSRAPDGGTYAHVCRVCHAAGPATSISPWPASS
jgi:hypothetical protein